MTKMSIRDAVGTLVKGGQLGDAEKVLQKAAAEARVIYQEIATNPMLSDLGKQQELARSYRSVNARVTDELNRMASRVRTSDRDDVANVFGTSGLRGDAGSLLIARRDADDRVAGLKTESERQELLRRATRSGDEVLARAVVQAATEAGDAQTVNMFTADRPNLEAATERLWNAERAQHDTFSTTVLVSALKPDELAAMPDWKLDHLADGDEPPLTPTPAPTAPIMDYLS